MEATKLMHDVCVFGVKLPECRRTLMFAPGGARVRTYRVYALCALWCCLQLKKNPPHLRKPNVVMIMSFFWEEGGKERHIDQ